MSRDYDTQSEIDAQGKNPVSASQIETVETCERLFAARYIHRLPKTKEQKPSAAVGSRVHEILELYEKDGTPPNRLEKLVVQEKDRDTKELKDVTYYPGQIAMAMLKHLDPAGSGGETESHFLFQMNGIWYQGYKDHKKPGCVRDYKTTKNIREYSIPEQDEQRRHGLFKGLEKNPQAVLYAVDAYSSDEADPTTDEVHCEWIYGQTKQAKGTYPTKVVRAVFTEDKALAHFEKYVEPSAKRIIALRTLKPEWKSLAPSPKSCDKYGGCPLKEDCNLSPREILMSVMNSNDALAALRARKAKQTAAAAGVKEETKEEPEETKPAAKGLDKLKPRAKGVNPPEKPVGAAAIAPAPESAEQEEEQEEAAEETQPEPAKEEPKPAAKKIPRKPKAEEPKPEPTNEEPKTSDFSGTGQKDRLPFTLYVDCSPIRVDGPIIQAADLIAGSRAVVEADAEVAHWGLIEFGRGAAYLAAQLGEDILGNPLPAGSHLVTSQYTPEGKATLQVLLELASEIVMGR